MFKYSSIKSFFLKILIGILSIGFAIFYIASLVTYNQNDPGFGTFIDGSTAQNISNIFGIYGSYLSSYSIIIIGSLSYFFALFILFEGFKSLVGANNNYFILKLTLNLFGIFIISYFSYFYKLDYINVGLISIFISDTFSPFFSKYITNNFLILFLNVVSLVFGIICIGYSLSLKFTFIKKLYFVLKFFKIIKYFNIIPWFKIFKIKSKSKLSKNKSEPTIKKYSFPTKNESLIKKRVILKNTKVNKFEFTLPDKNLLKKSTYKNSMVKETNKANSEMSKRLEKTLSEYGVEGKITGYKTGPIVTLFEFVPNAGIKSSKIIGLSEDIARAMSSISARISSQPGKTSMGIEIPNQKREGVFFGDLIDDERFDQDKNTLTLALGKNISGEKIFTDLEKMPHLLIAGTTGSGKSVGINTMIMSILFKFKPNECKLILIDPKMLELSIYEDIPHLLTPVVTNPNKAVFALKWVVREMENRYKLMSSVNVKNINSYNEKVVKTISVGRKLFREVQTGIDSDTRMPIIEKREIKLDKMPFIVVVIDEMADLMMVAGKEVESLVQRLAQMARASGIHLITATQRPSVDVITGTIKANFPSRISYKVASKFDSRTILNEMGAEQLLGSGDMLFLENGANIKRLHGGFISETEVEKVVNSIKEQATFDHKKEISLDEENINTKFDNDLVSNNNDELYNKAVDIIIKQQKVSTSYIQRYLQIGYNRAARIIEKMEEDGIISEANNAGKRHVLKKN